MNNKTLNPNSTTHMESPHTHQVILGYFVPLTNSVDPSIISLMV